MVLDNHEIDGRRERGKVVQLKYCLLAWGEERGRRTSEYTPQKWRERKHEREEENSPSPTQISHRYRISFL